MVKRFLDVGIAVADLHRAVDTYSRLLGAAPLMPGTGTTHTLGLEGARFYIEAATISLVASRDERSPIASFIASRGEGVNHISFEVADIDQAAKAMRASGIVFLTPEPLPFPQGQVMFTHPKSTHGVQIAIVQPRPGRQGQEQHHLLPAVGREETRRDEPRPGRGECHNGHGEPDISHVWRLYLLGGLGQVAEQVELAVEIPLEFASEPGERE